MLEKEIFFIGTRKIHSEKKNQDYFMVDYVYTGNNTPKTDYITLADFNKISQKGKPYTKMTGLFGINDFDKAYLCDIK